MPLQHYVRREAENTEISWREAGLSSPGLQPLVGSTTGLAGAWWMGRGHHPAAHLSTYLCSCGTGSQGWSSLMTPRFTASSTAHQFKWVEMERKPGHTTTISSKRVMSPLRVLQLTASTWRSSLPLVLKRVALFFRIDGMLLFFLYSITRNGVSIATG